MRVQAPGENVLGSSGLKETGGFKINATAQAFKILSSGLYSDKVRAVLREIGCNAHDAHVAAGSPSRPFLVKLPNALDDRFYIQDWGPGLSHDEVMQLYTTYFASTKQDSNDYTGAFGLGFWVMQDIGTYGELGTPGAFGWGSAYFPQYLVDPKERIVAFIMTQLMPAGDQDLNKRYKNLMYQALVK